MRLRSFFSAVRTFAPPLLIAVLIVSCAQRRYVITDPKELAALDAAWKQRNTWPRLDRLDYQIPIYAKYLEGLKICLDPGHGGDAHIPRYKRGPTDFREAVVNWGVALYLKDFLERSGAQVLFTRSGDEDVSLAARARLANEWPADIFLSIHHNAVGNPNVNRTTTWFHGDPDYRPSSLDLARYIQQGVADALRLPQVDGNPLKSDYLMYPGSGFGVIRPLRMTACLCEASFFTNPWEEYRLSKEWYWKREAYGLFLGLARYAWAGIPSSELLEPAAGSHIPGKQPVIRIQARTGFLGRGSWASERPWILTDSVSVQLDGNRIPHEFDSGTGIIVARVGKPLSVGEHRVLVGFRNYNGNYSRPDNLTFVVDPPAEKVLLTLTPETLPPEGEGVCRVRVQVLDGDGEPVLDGTPVAIGASEGKGDALETATKGGEAYAYLTAPPRPAGIQIVAVSAGRFATEELRFEPMPDRALLAAGVSDASTSEPVAGVECLLSVSGRTETRRTESDGWFLASTELHGDGSLTFTKDGYFAAVRPASLRHNASTVERVRLFPVLDGALHGQQILLDARHGGTETGDVAPDGSTAAAWNLELAQALAAKLRIAGAEPVLIRTGDETVTPEERVRRANRHRRADLYVRLDHRLCGDPMQGLHMDIYPNSASGRGIAAAVIERATRELGLADGGTTGVDDLEIQQTNMLAVSVAPFTMNHPAFSAWPRATLIDAEVDALLRGLARYFGWSPEERFTLTVQVPPEEAARLKDLSVRLSGTLTARVRPHGRCPFLGLAPGAYSVELLGSGGEVLGKAQAEVTRDTELSIPAGK